MTTIKDSVIEKLGLINYDLQNNDVVLIEFIIKKVENSIFNKTNLKSIPEQLNQILIDKVVGEFLFSMKNSGNLKLENLDFSPLPISIKEGDTDIKFSEKNTVEDNFNKLINNLMNSGDDEILGFRRIKW